MNDSTGNTSSCLAITETSSCLAITEKRPQRPGGCVGIFFQLFDWNRRLAKKKLFSKKLLPPGRAKRASKKFGGNEKLPAARLHLIADENRGGFPNVKKIGVNAVDMERKNEMRAPSLVARLMGLESMPAVQRDKPKKASAYEGKPKKTTASEFHVHGDEKSLGNCSGSDKEDVSLEKGQLKHELRPQKLQKTGQFERRSVTRFGAEAFQFKSILPRSRKHHPPKLLSPVKSPRGTSGRNASRLIDAAASKILEPGLKAANRAKCALTYSNSVTHPPKDEIVTEGMPGLSPDRLRQTGYYSNAGKSLMEHSSCKNCGNLLDVVDTRPTVEEQPSCFASSSNYVNFSSQASGASGMSKSRQPIPSVELENDVVFQNCLDQSISFASHSKEKERARSESFRDRNPFSKDSQERWHLSSQSRSPQKDRPASIALKHTPPTQNQVLLGRDGIQPRSKLSNMQRRSVSSAVNGSKDFVALNRSLSGRSNARMPTKVDNSKFEAERKSCNRRDDSISPTRTPLRKRRAVNSNGQVGNTNLAASTFGKQRKDRGYGMTEKGMGHNVGNVDCSMNRTSTKSKLASPGEGSIASGSKNTDAVSFTFNSPMKHKTGILSPKEMVEKRGDQDNFKCTSQQRKLTVDENDEKTSLQEPLLLRADALGAFLEQKMKELTRQEEDELATGGTPPIKTTAMILQELISALTTDQPIFCDDGAIGINQKDDICSHNYMFQAKAKMEGTSVGFRHDRDHFSPGSVLEASFSNDSCISSSLDECSVLKLHQDSMDYSYAQTQSSEPDTDLLDSATSLQNGRTGHEMVMDLINLISMSLDSINQAGVGLPRSKLTHAKEVILNAILLFGMKDFLIGSLFLDKLGTSNSFLSLDEIELKRFLFDSMIECLDSKYARYGNCGFKAWTRLPLCMNTDILIGEVDEEVRRWSNLTGKLTDEIIEWEMSHSLGKWMDFEIEGFEIGAEIGGDILQKLVDEIVLDLSECKLSSL